MDSPYNRMKKLVGGSPIYPPAISMWKHFPDTDRKPDRFLKRTVNFQLAGGWDFLKISYNGLYSIEDWPVVIEWPHDESTLGKVKQFAITEPEDWRNIKVNSVEEGALSRELTMVRRIVERFDGEVPVIATVFSPLTTAITMSGTQLITHLKDAPQAVHHALEIIAATTCNFVKELVKLEVAGIFFATQLASRIWFDWETYQEFGCPYDLAVLRQASPLWLNILHIHGHKPMFRELSTYPVVGINWHDRVAGPSLEEARDYTDKVLIGGINERYSLSRFVKWKARKDIANAVSQLPDGRLVLAPGCVAPLDVPEKRLFCLPRLRP